MQPFPDSETEDHRQALARPERVAAVAASGPMDSLPEEAFDRVVRLAARVTGVPVALFTLVDDQRQFFKARTGLIGDHAGVEGTPLSSSFCQYVATERTVLAVRDARQHPLLSRNGAIAGLDVIAYLGTPIHAPGGEVVGSLCAIDHQPHDWTDQQAEALRDLAAIIETELALRRSMDERALILTEMNHRVKNLFAMVGGMVRLARRAHDDTVALTADIEARVNALARAHQLIVPSSALLGEVATGVPLEQLLGALMAPYETEGEAGARVLTEGPDLALGPQATTSLALAFHELATNSVKYGALCSPGGQLRVTWTLSAGDLHLIWDERSPTPAGSAEDAAAGGGTGFGSQLLEMTIEVQLRGQLVTEPTETGLRHRITIPAAALAR